MSCLHSSEKLRGRLSHGWSGSSAVSAWSLQVLICFPLCVHLLPSAHKLAASALDITSLLMARRSKGDRQIKQSFLHCFPNREQDLSQKHPFSFLFSVICLNCFTRLSPPTGKTRKVSVWLRGWFV